MRSRFGLRHGSIWIAAAIVVLWVCCSVADSAAVGAERDIVRRRTVDRGLQWLANTQSRMGHWTARNGQYPTAMTALSGTALLCEGSTTTQGKYAPRIRRAVDYLVSRSCTNGLIGDPTGDDRYTYGHGFSMLFLSQVLGEEEDADRRQTLIDVLTRAVKFTGEAQTSAGGWGYVSAKDGNDFDEGSTTITQVQGLRGCRNAGIPVPGDIIDKAVKYIRYCTGPDGGVYYSSKHRSGGRPAITAAAVACLFNAGDYDDKYVPKLLAYCKKNLYNMTGRDFGHWHYTHYYYSQVLYREGGKQWEDYRDRVFAKILRDAASNGSWPEQSVGDVYGTAINLTILQLDNGTLPIYQR
ncbi:MAG TPA: prenyltransferase/squalene oxidase repeat-containing protein [Thermoguttaceae bacterium]|nr:prenyltransferase/squalene oxidase repeat-containing protein [Thermoguttaceae bacterium]